MIGLLCAPVFSYLPRTARLLNRYNLENCTRVFTSTAPFAILALRRLVRRCETGAIAEPKMDSVTLEEADEDIVTDYEDADDTSSRNPSPSLASHTAVAAEDDTENVSETVPVAAGQEGDPVSDTVEVGDAEDTTPVAGGTQEALLVLASCEIRPEDLD